MVVAVTELHLRGFGYFFPFLVLSIRSRNQATKAKGNLKVVTTNKGWRIGYTLTVWDNMENMLAFRNSGVHSIAMSRIRKYANKYKTLRYESVSIPAWREARERLSELPLLEI